MVLTPIATVFGAYGHTGRFIVAELRKRGWSLVLSGRDAGKLNALAAEHGDLEARPASVDSPEALDRALAGSSLVINCAGPFLDTAEPILAAALRSGSHYLDVTAEQSSAAATYERFDASARDAGLILIPAMGFYGGLVPLPDPAPTDSWKFPEPFGTQEVVELPFSETILIARHLRVSALHTYLNIAPLKDLRDPATPPPAPADETGRSAQSFMVDVVVKNGSHTRRATARGRDIYAVTAPLVAEAARRILDGSIQRRGVLAPGDVFDAPSFLRALAPQHLLLEI
jgi:short subunit dehydrogenase-like uncharacterized protein